MLLVANLQSQSLPNRCAASSSDYFYKPIIQGQLDSIAQEWEEGAGIAFSRSIVIIPVVVHIVWRTEEENISDEQVYSQISALNRDFQLLNDDLAIIPTEFKSRIGKVGFEFCLASLDENGNPTTGITRTATRFENVAALTKNPLIYYTDRGGQDAWDTQRYLNIWVADTPENFYIGYGSRPGERPAQEDGVLVHPRYFGTIGTATAPFNFGRTATHEIGHYFNLRHLNGDNSLCGEGDGVVDTPKQGREYFGCPIMEQAFSCGSLDLVANYMNKVEDACMAMFTRGQVQRMHIALFGARNTLTESAVCVGAAMAQKEVVINVFPTPAKDYVFVETESKQLTIPYRIIDTRGAIIQQGIVGGSAASLVNVPALSGFYWIQFFLEEEVLTKKLLLL